MLLDYTAILESKVNGKTYSAVRFLIQQKQKRNCTIVTNVKSFCAFEDTIYITDINDLIDWTIDYCDRLDISGQESNVIIFFDEIFTILSRDKAVDKKFRSFLSQFRKRKIIFVTTAQEWLELPMTFRRYCRYQIESNMTNIPLTNRAILFNYIYDAENMKWSQLDNDYIAPIIQTNIAKGNLRIIKSYDTFETISTQ